MPSDPIASEPGTMSVPCCVATYVIPAFARWLAVHPSFLLSASVSHLCPLLPPPHPSCAPPAHTPPHPLPTAPSSGPVGSVTSSADAIAGDAEPEADAAPSSARRSTSPALLLPLFQPAAAVAPAFGGADTGVGGSAGRVPGFGGADRGEEGESGGSEVAGTATRSASALVGGVSE